MGKESFQAGISSGIKTRIIPGARAPKPSNGNIVAWHADYVRSSGSERRRPNSVNAQVPVRLPTSGERKSPSQIGAESGEVRQIEARDAWAILKSEVLAVLIDIRTKFEWSYVGIPDLSALGKSVLLCEWQRFPEYDVNPDFCGDLEQSEAVQSDAPLLFLCRSGDRARGAAKAMAQQGYRQCYHIVDGFEGDLSGGRRRGLINGWKAASLPWMQT